MRSASLLAFVLLVPLAVSQEAKVVTLDWNDIEVPGDKTSRAKRDAVVKKYLFKKVQAEGVLSKRFALGEVPADTYHAWLSSSVKRGDIDVTVRVPVSFRGMSVADMKAITDAVANKTQMRIVGDGIGDSFLKLDKAKLLK